MTKDVGDRNVNQQPLQQVANDAISITKATFSPAFILTGQDDNSEKKGEGASDKIVVSLPKKISTSVKKILFLSLGLIQKEFLLG